jgi:hypothetical protein
MPISYNKKKQKVVTKNNAMKVGCREIQGKRIVVSSCQFSCFEV